MQAFALFFFSPSALFLLFSVSLCLGFPLILLFFYEFLAALLVSGFLARLQPLVIGIGNLGAIDAICASERNPDSKGNLDRRSGMEKQDGEAG